MSIVPAMTTRHVWLALVVALVPVRAEESGFWQQLTPEERRAAGVDRLTPPQQAALDELAGRYAREGARQISEQAKQEVREEVKRDVRAEVIKEVREEVTKEVQAETKAKEEAKVGLKESRNESIHTRIKGEFKGWTGTTVFRLENGQAWVQEDRFDRQWIPTMTDPEVEIRQSGLGGWKLYVLPKRYWVRVKRID